SAAAVSHPTGPLAPLPSFPATDGAAYRVFPIPFESPSDGDRELVTNAANPAASPFGWHDTNGLAGPEFNVTRGNNVHAYADRDNNNVPDPGSDPSGGALLQFDFDLDLTRRPFDSQPAFVTNLFYWNNIMHDVTFGYGFNEAAGNFQVNNYGHGGLGNDDVRAEAQDGSGRNNANFGTPVDGQRPRMQMFEWRSAAPNPVTVNSPASIAGTYYGPMAGFGESLTTTGAITGNIAVVNDGVGVTSDGCEPFAVPAGAIPLADRGACNFTVKVKNAQLAGAAMAIVANNIAGPPIAMGGTDPTINIPSVMISLDDANLFKANLPVNVTVRDGTGGAPDRDSDIDAGVISHEYGHGVSNRLTGGPATVSCLNNAEQMGEGWSDWFALNLTARPSDTRTTARGVGTYVSFEPPTGPGIRPTPYTTDMAVNPSTYAWVADTVNISQPHGIGYVWNTMLWEMYWNLVDRYGFNPNIYDAWTTGGNNLAMQLVIDGMKMQACRPGFVDGRNAILAADTALTGGTNQCEIWRAFAKRGLGVSANQGSSNNRTDGVEAFDLPASCLAATFGGFEAPIEAAPALNSANAGSTVPVKFALTGAGDSFQIDSQAVNCSTLEPTGETPSPLETPGSTHLRIENGFHVNWQTDASWAGTCRRVTLRIPAAADAVAFYQIF
ncbi:MAG: M36 family metallopeptidase, partial [Acidobacteriota bacterium]